MTDHALLDVRDLVVSRTVDAKDLVRGISFEVGSGETVALVGESGSGKSLTARSLLGLLPEGLHATGSATWEGTREIFNIRRRRLPAFRGSEVGLLLQDPFTSLNPLNQVGRQLEQTLRSRRGQPRGQTATEVSRRLAEVGIDAEVAKRYPFELSGGMRQRIGMAAALAKDPRLLIADEPTTALDATTQREVLKLLRAIQEQRRMSLLLITHDLQVAFSMADRVVVMKEGLIVEVAPSEQLRSRQESDYAKRLIGSALPLDRRLSVLVRDETSRTASRPGAAVQTMARERRPVLEVTDLSKTYRRAGSGAEVTALRSISVTVGPGESLGVVGESGSGKTTFARCILGLERPTAGSIRSGDIDLCGYDDMGRDALLEARRRVQCVFQDPYSSLNPAHSVGTTLAEAIRHRAEPVQGASLQVEIERLLDDVGLPGSYAARKPSALSGGQRQRVAIARALALDPRLLICDEPVAALDLTVQAQVLQLLRGVQDRGVSLIFVTHDLAVARQMTDRLVVLHRGVIVESGETADVIDRPQHDYTRKLIGAVPTGHAGWLATQGTEVLT